jgi:hypothetical protein
MAVLLLWLACRAAAQDTVFYVATNGNDAWSGRLAEPNAGKTDGPFATLERAGKYRPSPIGQSSRPLSAVILSSRHPVTELFMSCHYAA